MAAIFTLFAWFAATVTPLATVPIAVWAVWFIGYQVWGCDCDAERSSRCRRAGHHLDRRRLLRLGPHSYPSLKAALEGERCTNQWMITRLCQSRRLPLSPTYQCSLSQRAYERSAASTAASTVSS